MLVLTNYSLLIIHLLLLIIVRAKKQLWATSLCHSLVQHTIRDLQLYYIKVHTK